MSVSALRLGRGSALAVVISLLLGLSLTGCGGTPTASVSFKGNFLPVGISISTDGKSFVQGDVSYATAIGTFSIGAKYDLPQRNSSSIYVILRNRHTGFDKVYEVRTDGAQFNAVVNGTTSITVTRDQVLIDITSGTIRKIAFKQVHSQLAEASNGGWWPGTRHAIAARWDAGWAQSWYKPYGMARWAYSDSTIEKWYGAGFVWFLLRLAFAIILGLIDTLLTLGFLLGQAAFIIFGPTGRDVTYGLIVLGVIVTVIGMVLSDL
jgi:hypothetical protein